MNKVYSRINWENEPSANTPINETNLNKMDYALNEVDNRLIEQDTTKLSKTDASNDVVNWTMDEDTGVITVTRRSGEKIIFDLNIEKIPVSFSLSDDGILTMITDDGTAFTANIGAMIPILTFSDSDEIAVSVTGTGVNKTYSFSIKTGSITEDMLETGYLSNIKVEVAKAELAVEEAQSSETLSDYNAKLSQSYAIGLSSIREGEDTDNAMYYAEQAENSATEAETSENNAYDSASTATEKATEASNSALVAATSETNASASAAAANLSETNAKTSENNSKISENNASVSATAAANGATESESYAHGGTGTRENEDIDNAEYYYKQTKEISEGLKGGLLPHGTILFAELPDIADVGDGWMYNISDEFTTTADFKEGSGLTIPSGSNVYKTSDGYWDVLAGSPVTGVKGNAESSYRKGNVNITPANIGLGNVPNVATNDQTPTFTQASTRANIASGEKLSIIFGKIMKFFADLKTVAFSGSYADLSNKPSNATSSEDGFMSSTDKSKLDGIASGANAYTHPSYTARTGVPTSNQTPSFGGSFTVTQPVSDATGHITGMNSRSVTIPNTVATQTSAGLESADDKKKLDGIAAGAQVNSITGVKGNAESSYRTGNVNLTPANLGALATNGDSKSNTVTFTSNDVADGSATSWTNVTKLASGITHATFLQRVSQMFKNVRYMYKVLGTTDISEIGDGTVRGAISTLNSNLAKKVMTYNGTVQPGDVLTVTHNLNLSNYYPLVQVASSNAPAFIYGLTDISTNSFTILVGKVNSNYTITGGNGLNLHIVWTY